MNLTIRRVGNSLGVILPKELLEKHNVGEGDELNVIDNDGDFTLRPRGADLSEQLKAARIGMAKYRSALRELAK
jgi:putative addiction module antidote